MSAAAFEARYRADADPWRTLSDPAELAKAAHVLPSAGTGRSPPRSSSAAASAG